MLKLDGGLLANALHRAKLAQTVAVERPPEFFMIRRDLQIENLKKEIDLLRAELEKIKLEVRLDPAGVSCPRGIQQRAPPSARAGVRFFLPQSRFWFLPLLPRERAVETAAGISEAGTDGGMQRGWGSCPAIGLFFPWTSRAIIACKLVRVAEQLILDC